MAGLDDCTLQIARKRVDAFSALMEQHRGAMKCRDCEELLRSGIDAYESLSDAERIIRQAAVEGFHVPSNVVTALDALYRAWLESCPLAEEQVKQQEKLGFTVANLAEFKTACDAVRRKISFLQVEEDLESAFRGDFFDEAFWTEARKSRSPQCDG
jgi:hypothetical protein